MKKIIFAIMLVLTSTIASANIGDWSGSGMMGYGTGYSAGWMVAAACLGIIYFILASFIFSTVFWLTKKWLIKDKKR